MGGDISSFVAQEVSGQESAGVKVRLVSTLLWDERSVDARRLKDYTQTKQVENMSILSPCE